MIEFYKELEDRKNQYLTFFENNDKNNYKLEVNSIPLNYYQTNLELFNIIRNLDLLYMNTVSWNFDKVETFTFFDVDEIANKYLAGSNLETCDISNSFKCVLDFLLTKFNYSASGDNYYDYLYQYVTSILNIYLLNSKIFLNDRKALIEYFTAVKTVARFQGKLSLTIEKKINQKINELNNHKLIISAKSKKIQFLLPDSWYITPSGELYNSMGETGHKEANLKYAYMDEIEQNLSKKSTSKYYLKKVSIINSNGFITHLDYKEGLNLVYNFPGFDNNKSYDKQLIKLILGIYNAHICFYKFFEELKEKSSNYVEDLNYIEELGMEDLLVRCCGFHKISSQTTKTITTSCIDYENQFGNYISNGWHIDFIPPIIINENKGRLEECPKESLVIRKILKKI